MLNDIKTELTVLLDISRDALHIHLGIAIYLAAIVLVRRGPTSLIPWFVLLGFELVNEVLDTFHGDHLSLDIAGSLRDIANTMLWPTIALIVARVVLNRRQRGQATASTTALTPAE